MNKLKEFVGSNPLAFCHLRALIKRSFTKMPEYKTVFFITGPTSSGKSAFVQFLKMVLHDNMHNLEYRKQNEFEGSNWIDKLVLLVNDVNYFDFHTIQKLRQISGRDELKSSKKYIQLVNTFVYEGIVIVVSNQTANELNIPFVDIDWEERVIEIPFCRRISKINPNLASELFEDIAGILNWAFSCPQEVLDTHVRNEYIPPDSDHLMILFIEARIKLSENPKSLLPLKDLKKEFGEFTNEASGKKLVSCTNNKLSDMLLHFMNLVFGIELKVKMRDGLKCIQGIELTENSDDTSLPRIEMPLPFSTDFVFDSEVKESLSLDSDKMDNDKNSLKSKTQAQVDT